LIKDDVPLASWTAPVLADEASLNTIVNGQLNFNGGADGAEVTSVFHHWQNANDGTVKIYDGPNGTAFTLTSGGEAVIVTYEDNGMTMVGKLSDDTEVFRLEAQSDGNFTFEQSEAIDHPLGSTQEDDLLLKLKFTVTDADGDTSTSNFGVKIADTEPTANHGGTKDISEADIDTLVPASVNGQLTFDAGADGATITDVNFWGEGSQVMVYDGQGNQPISLTSNGDPVIATQTVDANGVITITAVANTTPVYTLVMQPDGNYDFTLLTTIDHPQSSQTGQDSELLLRYSYIVTDGDADTDIDYFSINIIDLEPTITNDTNSVSEAESGIISKTSITGNILDNDIDGEFDDLLTIIEFTSDNTSQTLTSYNNSWQGDGYHFVGQYGNIKLWPDGSYLYNLYNDRADTNALAEGEQVTEVFTYKVTNENGEESTATLTINITGTDDLPEFEVATVANDINGIDLTSLDFSSGFNFVADVKLNNNSETFFRQNNNGSNSFLIEFGDDDHSSPHNPGTYLQLYIPLINGGVYKAVTIDPLTTNDWHSLEINYDPINGASVSINGQNVAVDDSFGDLPSIMKDVTDSNYTIGSTSTEDFNGEFKNISITSLEDNSEVVPNLVGNQTLFIQEDVDDGITDMASLLQNVANEVSPLDSLDEIDLTAGNHILSNISVEDVLAITDNDNTLKITGDNGDSIDLDLAMSGTSITDINGNTSSITTEGIWYKDSSQNHGDYEAFVGKDSNGDVVKLLIDQDTTPVI